MKERYIQLHVMISLEAREKLGEYQMSRRVPARYGGERVPSLGEALTEILEKLEVKEE